MRGTTSPSKTGPVFNGHLTVVDKDAAVWTWPLRWRGSNTPRRGVGARSMIFVGDMSDLFHKDRPLWVIDRVFAAMALAWMHDFLVLTKRPDVMAEYTLDPADASPHMEHCSGDRIYQAGDFTPRRRNGKRPPRWPLPNVWKGTSAERQIEVNQRVRWLGRCLATIRFVSAEPLLGNRSTLGGSADGATIDWAIDWVIAGGESGPNARPMHPDWARSLRDQCTAAGVPFFFKQWGGWEPRSAGCPSFSSSGVDGNHVQNGAGTSEAADLSRWWRSCLMAASVRPMWCRKTVGAHPDGARRQESRRRTAGRSRVARDARSRAMSDFKIPPGFVEDSAPEDVRPGNLAALCQRCHLNHDRPHHRAVQRENRRQLMCTEELLLEMAEEGV